MEKFFQLFKRNLKTGRLEMRILEPTPENAKLVWDALKNENPNDFEFIHFSPKYDKPLPESFQETLDTMINYANAFKNDGLVWYIFQNDKLIGFYSITYNQKYDSVNSSNVWFIKSAWGHGFNREIHDIVEKIAFEDMKIHRMTRQCMVNNTRSQKSILASGYQQEGCLREYTRLTDGTWTDHLLFSKLAREYKK